MDTNDLTKEEIQALYDIAQDMQLAFGAGGQPMYLDKLGQWANFEPLHDDTSAMAVQVHFRLCMEITEYGVFVRQTDGRMLLWREFPRDVQMQAELHICRRALFQAAHKVVREAAQQAEIIANS